MSKVEVDIKTEKPKVATIAQKVLAQQVISHLGNIALNMSANAAAYKTLVAAGKADVAAQFFLGDAQSYIRLLNKITQLRDRNDKAYQDAIIAEGIDPGEAASLHAALTAVAERMNSIRPVTPADIQLEADTIILSAPVIEILK